MDFLNTKSQKELSTHSNSQSCTFPNHGFQENITP
jgi:hypothetical protein